VPKLPSMQEGQRVQTGAPVAIGGTGDARMMGEAISGLANPLMRLAQAHQVKKETKNKLDRMELEDFAARKALEAKLFALKNPDAAPDGSSTWSDFSSVYDEVYDRLSGLPPDLQRDARQIFNRTENKYKEALIPVEIKKYNEYTGLVAEESREGMAEEIRQDPGMVLDSYSRFVQKIEALPWTADQKAKVIEEAKNDIPWAMVEGHIRTGTPDRFKKAREVLKSPVMKVMQQKEAQMLADRIDNLEETDRRKQLSIEEEKRKREEREISARQEKNFSKIMVNIGTADTIEARQQIVSDADKLYEAKGLTYTQWKATRATNAAVPEYLDNETHSRYLTRIYDTRADMGTVNGDLTADLAAGRIRPSTAAGLFQLINKQKNKSTSLPSDVRMMLNRNLKTLDEVYYGKNVKRDIFGRPTGVPPHVAEMKRVAERALISAAHKGGNAALEREYQRIIKGNPGGDLIGFKQPKGVSTSALTNYRAARAEAEKIARQMAHERDSKGTNTQRYRELSQRLVELEPILTSLQEQEEQKQSGRAAPAENTGRTNRRRPRR
jgi:hypothetical protein